MAYFESEKPEERVVGYIAYQASPFPSMELAQLEFHAALEREVTFAERVGETRPLWQLLVAIAIFAAVSNAEYLQFIRFDLRSFLSRFEARPDLDPTGECKEKMRGLIATYHWMSRTSR